MEGSPVRPSLSMQNGCRIDLGVLHWFLHWYKASAVYTFCIVLHRLSCTFCIRSALVLHPFCKIILARSA